MSVCPLILHYQLTDHAELERQRREIELDVVEYVLRNAEQTAMVRPGCCLYQARINYGDPPKQYLVRIFVDVDRPLPEIVTIYRTSKIDKYWR